MASHQALTQFLADATRAGRTRTDVAAAVGSIGDACCAIAEHIALGSLAEPTGNCCEETPDWGEPGRLGRLAGEIMSRELRSAPVACVATEEADLPVACDSAAPLCVAVEALYGASNLDINVAGGTLFSVFPMRCAGCQPRPGCFVQRGREQLAAGYVVYGPRTSLVLTIGDGTHLFTLNPDTGEFCLTKTALRIPEDTNEFAINTSNFRRWDGHIRAYIEDCLKGVEGPHGKNYDMRWIDSLVAECHRIMIRGGIFLYPGDRRAEYCSGRLRLAFECNPIAFLVEQAGGAATTGHQNVLDLEPTDLGQRVPLIFGSLQEVRLLEHYYRETRPFQERSPLFGNRGLFRTG